MKKNLFVVMVLGLLGVASSQAQIPVVEDNGTTAGGTVKFVDPENLPVTLQSAGGITVKLIPVFGPITASFAQSAVDAVKNNTPPPGGVLSSVLPKHLMTFPDGTGAILWVIDATASPGTSVSLADVFVAINGSDGQDLLAKTVSFVGASHTSAAPLIMHDGTEITSGPATQQGRRVIVGVWGKTFTISSSQDETAVKNWFWGFEEWDFTTTVTAQGSTATHVLRKLPPALTPRVTNSRFIVAAESNGDPRNYEVVARSSVTGSWVSTGSTLRAGMELDLGPVSFAPARFVGLRTP